MNSGLQPGVSMRKCFVLREVEVPMEELKKGDVFRLEPATPDDAVNVGHHEYSLAKNNASKLENEEWNCVVEASNISFVLSEHPRQLRFRT